MVLLSLLLACQPKWATTWTDLDGDGYTVSDGDCHEGDPEISPAAAEIWYDGADQDCDGNDGDQDGDGFVTEAYAARFPALAALFSAGDCWDDPAEPGAADFAGGGVPPGPAEVFPGAADAWYDGVDADCAGDSDFDQDGDGHDSAFQPRADGSVGEDCVDGSAADAEFMDESGAAVDPADLGIFPEQIHPEAADACYDAIDADCDGWSDFDCDRDGFDRLAECDDGDAAVYPNPEIPEVWYDGFDQNCDGNDGDQDGDGFVPDALLPIYDGLGLAWTDFPAHAGTGDCADDPAAVPAPLNGLPAVDASAIWPGASDAPYDGLDADCAGDGDFDADDDGEDSAAHAQRDGSVGPDCDDGDDAVHTGATEDCASVIDDNCDGTTNALDALGCVIFYVDADSDGFGGASGACACEPLAPYLAENDLDCLDSRSSVYPGAPELIADSADQDCDGGDACYQDADLDGYGVSSSVPSADLDCADAGESTSDADCDDADAGRSPGNVELAWDGIDNDCEGSADALQAADAALSLVYGNTVDDATGGLVRLAGDLNGDGSAELLLGVPLDDAGGTSSGSLVRFEASSLSASPDLGNADSRVLGISSSDSFATALVWLGDVDGDGFDEVAAGCPGDDAGDIDGGAAWILDFYGQNGSGDADLVADGGLYGQDNNGEYGAALDAGDRDGDGLTDLAVAAPGELSGRGRVYVHAGGEGWESMDIEASNNAGEYYRGEGGGLGSAVMLRADLDADGNADLVACAGSYSLTGGTCWLVTGASSPRDGRISAYDQASFSGDTYGDGLGSTLESVAAGDLDADGQADLLLGAPGHDGGGSGAGAVIVFFGGNLSGNYSFSDADILIQGDGALGTAIFAGQDGDGDGAEELLLGAPSGGGGPGAVYLLPAGLTAGTFTLPTDAAGSWTGASSGDLFGSSIHGFVDLNGDGVGDFAVGAPGETRALRDDGVVRVLNGP